MAKIGANKCSAFMLEAPGVANWLDIPLGYRFDDLQVHVSTIRTAVSVGSERRLFLGNNFNGEVRYPLMTGYESLGVVTSSRNQDEFLVGDRVLGVYGHRSSWIESTDRLIKVPEHWTDEFALGLILASDVYWPIHTLLDRLPKRVAVVGAGVIGLLSVFVLSHFGVQDIVVVDPVLSRGSFATAFGATQREASISEVLGEVDALIECSGDPATLKCGPTIVRRGGDFLVISDLNDTGRVEFSPDLLLRNLRLQAFDSSNRYKCFVKNYEELFGSANELLSNLFDLYMPRQELRTVFEGLASNKLSPRRVMIDW